MAIAKNNPKYYVYIHTDSRKINITGALLGLTLTENAKELAQKVTMSFTNVTHEGKTLASHINVHDKVYIYASTGDGAKEVFRGYVWTDVYDKGDGNVVNLTCYDRLIYLMESEEYRYIPKGKTTKAIFKLLCDAKGIDLSYNHSTMKHAKMTIRGTLADVFWDDLLENVRKKTGKRGVIRMTKSKMEVFTEGNGNSTIWKFTKGSEGNIIKTKHESTLDGLTTKVIILGKEEDGKAPTKATLKKNTDKYGTIQKIMQSSDSDKLATVKKEAQQTLDDYAKPQLDKEVTAVDNPWVRKGDKIYINDDWIKGYANVISVSHDAMKKTMRMEIRMT